MVIDLTAHIENVSTGGGCIATFIDLSDGRGTLVATNIGEGVCLYRDRRHFWDADPRDHALATYVDLTTAIDAVSK